MDSVTWQPPATGSMAWLPVTRNPGAVLTQVKPAPGFSSVTRQYAGGNFGWCTRARLPTCKGPGESFLTRETLAVHSGQRSTSAITDHTRRGAAGISTMILKLVGVIAWFQWPGCGHHARRVRTLCF